METGFTGTFVISWSQTELDGLVSAPTDALRIGAVWSWHGDSLRLDGPTELLRLEGAEGEEKDKADEAAALAASQLRLL